MSLRLLALGLIGLLCLCAHDPSPAIAARARKGPQVLPKPEWENCFWLTIGRTKELEFESWEGEYANIVERLGQGGMYARLNYDGADLSNQFVQEHGLYRSYAWNSPLDAGNPAYTSTDRRARQWNQFSEIVDDETKLAKGNPADSDLTPSGYFVEGWEGMLSHVRRNAKDYMSRRESERFRVFAGPNEFEYLFFGGDKWYADYGPFAQAEFRDWLTHRGEFAQGGRFEGKGRAGGEEFADDPTPDRAKGRNKSFNAEYGTKFTTWELAYWDLARFPEALAKDAKGMPAKGEAGFIEGGFDAPRAPGASLWSLWQCCLPESPGYRQWRIADALNVMLRVAVEECGVPKAEVWTRQHGCRDRGAMLQESRTVLCPWMNVTPYSNIGWNLYGVSREAKVWADSSRLAQEAGCDWGSYEFHPSPYELDKISTADYLLALNLFRQNGARMVRCVTWLGNNTGKSAHGMAPGSMRIRDTPFEDALRSFVAGMKSDDRPWGSDADAEWLTPAPRELSYNPASGTLTWSDKMWEGEPFRYDQWAKFEYFQVATCDGIGEEGEPSGLKRLDKIKRGEPASIKLKPDKLKPLLIVRGVSEGKLESPWSEPVAVK